MPNVIITVAADGMVTGNLWDSLEAFEQERMREKLFAEEKQRIEEFRQAYSNMINYQTGQFRHRDSRRLSPEEEARRMALYEKGFTDREIAQKTKRSLNSIRLWRDSRGLQANASRDTKKTCIMAE